jgi:hypothetical protein
MSLLLSILSWLLGLFRSSPPAPRMPPPAPAPVPVTPAPVDAKPIEKRWADEEDPGNELGDRRRRKP